MTDEQKKLLQERYGSSENHNFSAVDTIGIPHPFCIGPKHIDHAQHFGGILSRECIEDLEKKIKQPSCAMRGCRLMLEEHETALLISCEAELKIDDKPNPELKTYLQSIVSKCEEDKYAGFAFADHR